MTKTEFLKNLEKALKKIMPEMFDEGEISEDRIQLEKKIEEFVRESAGEYTLEELMETFTSAQTTIALFLEFQDAKRISGESDHP
jgi:hypothetical protein